MSRVCWMLAPPSNNTSASRTVCFQTGSDSSGCMRPVRLLSYVLTELYSSITTVTYNSSYNISVVTHWRGSETNVQLYCCKTTSLCMCYYCVITLVVHLHNSNKTAKTLEQHQWCSINAAEVLQHTWLQLCYSDTLNLAVISDENSRFSAYRRLIRRLPDDNRATLNALFGHFYM